MPASSPSEPPAREARLFRNDRSQAMRIPADWEPPGDRVAIRHDGERLILKRPRGLLDLLSSWEALDEALPKADDPPPPADPNLGNALEDVPDEGP